MGLKTITLLKSNVYALRQFRGRVNVPPSTLSSSLRMPTYDSNMYIIGIHFRSTITGRIIINVIIIPAYIILTNMTGMEL